MTGLNHGGILSILFESLLWFLLNSVLINLASRIMNRSMNESEQPQRFLWMTHEKRIVLPPGTQLVLTPTLAMPLIRYPPEGLDANMTISTPFTSKADYSGFGRKEVGKSSWTFCPIF